jgi:hypothetical protein
MPSLKSNGARSLLLSHLIFLTIVVGIVIVVVHDNSSFLGGQWQWQWWGVALAQTPTLVGLDAFSHPFLCCQNADVFSTDSPPVLLYTECDSRSDGCNIDNSQCILSQSIVGSGGGINVNFAVTTFAQVMPGVNDGKVVITVNSTSSPILLKGFLQLWKLISPYGVNPAVYNMTFSQRFMTPVVTPQTATFHGLVSGYYVAVFQDTGGTIGGAGTPATSQQFFIPLLYSSPVQFFINFIPNDGMWTDIFHLNRHLVGHQFTDSTGMYDQILRVNAALAGYNRVFGFEHLTDQGNPLNIKRDISMDSQTNPTTIFKFKHFPMMPGAKYTQIRARLFYVGLFPASYSDYFTTRGHLGFGTVLATKIMVLQRVVTTAYDYPYLTIPLTTLKSISATTDQLTLFVVQRERCLTSACPGGQALPFPGADSGLDDMYNTGGPTNGYCTGKRVHDNPSNCAIAKDDEYAQQGMYSMTNDFNVFEDFYDDDDSASDNFAETRGWRFAFSFKQHTNSDSGVDFDYACAPFNTHTAAGVQTAIGGGNNYASTLTLADIHVDYTDMLSFLSNPSAPGEYCAPPSGFCNCVQWTEKAEAVHLCTQSAYSFYFYYGIAGGYIPTPVNATYGLNFVMNSYYIIGEINPGDFPYPLPSYDGGTNPYSPADTTDCLTSDNVRGTAPTSRKICVKRYATFPRDAFGSGDFIRDENFYGDVAPYYQRAVQFLNFGYNELVPSLPGALDRPFFLTPVGCGGIGAPSNPPCNAPTTSGPSIVNTVREWLNTTLQGSFGLDTQLFTLTTRIRTPGSGGGANDRAILVSSTPVYARFKVAPTIEFLYFTSFRRGTSFNTIQATFMVSCPLLDLGQPQANGAPDSTTAYCAEFWTVTNQNYQAIVVTVDYGGYATLPNAQAMVAALLTPPNPPNQALAEVITTATFTVTIKHNDGDVLQWIFSPRLEPEQPLGTDFCTGPPGPFASSLVALQTEPVPPLKYIYQPMVNSVDIAPPVCEGQSAEMLSQTCRGEPYVFAVVLQQDLASVGTQGQTFDNGRTTDYWESYNINGTIVDGFAEQYQLYNSNTQLTVYDQFSSFTQTGVGPVPFVAQFTNPIVRESTCTPTPEAICAVPTVTTNASSPFSSIIQYHFWTPEFGQQALLVCDPVFVPPFTQGANVGSLTVYETPDFEDTLLEETATIGIHQLTPELTVNNTDYYTCKIRYGKTIDGLFEAPCYERLICYTIMLSPIFAQAQPVRRVTPCNDPNDCCYTVDFIVTGNTPYTVDQVNLTACAAQGIAECKYEIIVSPTVPSLQNLCLGHDYTFTFQSPAELVAQRESPDQGTFFAYAYREPAVVAVQIPSQGFSPVAITLVPGTCIDPGSVVEMTFSYTSPACTGEISGNNPNPACDGLELVLSFNRTNRAGAGSPYPYPDYVIGTNSGFHFQYNLAQQYIFPNYVNDSIPASMPLPLADGTYNLLLWVRAVGSQQSFAAAASADARNAIAVSLDADLADDSGITIIELAPPQIPRCPGPPIILSYNIQDLTWNGPYTTVLRTPSGIVIYNVTGPATADYCDFAVCGLTFNNVTGCSACDIKMREFGVDVTIAVGTGPFSVESDYGGYKITARAALSQCNSPPVYTYFSGLGTLLVQLQCVNVTCAETQTGGINVIISGGTVIPLPQRQIVINPFTQTQQVYYCEWNTTAGARHQCALVGIPEGFYELNVTDFNGCSVTAGCEISAPAPRVQIRLAGVSQPNCTNTPGGATFEVFDGVEPYTVVKVGSDQRIIATTTGNQTVVQDTNVVTGVQYHYLVLDALNCPSAIIPVTVPGAPNFTMFIQTVESPCTNTDSSGRLFAFTTPLYTGTVFAWFKNNVDLHVSSPSLIGVGIGIYTVVAMNPFGCRVTSSISLTASGQDITLDFQRIAVNSAVDALIGSVVGGNGPPFTITLSPNQNFEINLQTTTPEVVAFEVLMVPLEWSGRITATDKDGCFVSQAITGDRIPDTITPFTQSPTPAFNPSITAEPVAKKKHPYVTSPEHTALIVGTTTIFFVILLIIYIWNGTNGFRDGLGRDAFTIIKKKTDAGPAGAGTAVAVASTSGALLPENVGASWSETQSESENSDYVNGNGGSTSQLRNVKTGHRHVNTLFSKKK